MVNVVFEKILLNNITPLHPKRNIIKSNLASQFLDEKFTQFTFTPKKKGIHLDNY